MSNTVLSDRILWYDGASSFTPEMLKEYLLTGHDVNDKIFVSEINEEIKQFNKFTDTKISVKTHLDDMNHAWNFPEEYKHLNLNDFIYDKLLKECKNNSFTKEEINTRLERVECELELYSKYNIIDILLTLIFIVDKFKTENVVWGTGRGSSCSSYILYLIELHDVDSVEYDLDINEFFR